MKLKECSYVNNSSDIMNACVLLESTIQSKIELQYLVDD